MIYWIGNSSLEQRALSIAGVAWLSQAERAFRAYRQDARGLCSMNILLTLVVRRLDVI